MEAWIINERGRFLSVEGIHETSPDAPPKVVVYDRVSTDKQKDNLEARKAIILQKCEENGFEVLGYVSEIANGKTDQLCKRKKLREAFQLAIQKSAILVAASVNRFARTSGEKDTPLNLDDYQLLDEFLWEVETDDVEMGCLIPPGTPPSEVEATFKRWGQAGKGNYGGRPRKSADGEKTKLRETYLPFVKKWRKTKTPFRVIRDLLCRKYGKLFSLGTLHGWAKREEKKLP